MTHSQRTRQNGKRIERETATGTETGTGTGAGTGAGSRLKIHGINNGSKRDLRVISSVIH